MDTRTEIRDYGIPRFVATVGFAVLVAFPLAQVFQRIDFGAPMPEELLPTAYFSLKQASLSLAASLLVGVPLGVFYAGVWTRWLRSFSVASFSLPGLLVIGMMTLLFRGTEFRFGLGSVVVAHAFLNAPWIAVATAEGIRSVPRGWVDAARTLGATRTRAFYRIELPWIARRIAVAAAQVFALCLMSFAIVLVLGGGPPVSTLETEIYAAVRGSGLELSKAAWFGVAELLLAAIPLILAVGYRSGPQYRDTLASRPLAKAPTSARSQVAHAVAATWLILPGVCFLRSASFTGFSEVIRNPELHEALGVSLEIAFAVVAASLITGGFFALGARHSQFVRMIAAFPAGLSPLLVSLGFFLAYSSWIDPFEGSILGMVGVQTTLFLPFALRFFLPLIDEERTGPRRDLRLAARTLGATAWVAWKKLEWPRWQAAGLRLGALVFVWSFSELAAASFFGSERLTTLGVLLVRWLAQYRFEEVNLVLFGIYLFSAGVLLVTAKEEV